MRIGIDVDGVLADFVSAYQPLFVEVTGRNKFEPGDIDNPPSWNWPTDRGYTAEETREVWKRIFADPEFWLNLHTIPHEVETLQHYYDHIVDAGHEVTFITNRAGIAPRLQTEQWLEEACGVFNPHVVIVGQGMKGHIAKAMELDCYVDDNYDNALDVILLSKARTYLRDCAYNRGLMQSRSAAGKAFLADLKLLESRRITTLEDFFNAEKLI